MLAGKPTLTSDRAHIRTDSRTTSPAADSSNVVRAVPAHPASGPAHIRTDPRPISPAADSSFVITAVSGRPASGPEGVKIYWYSPGQSIPGVNVRSSV